MLTLRLAWRSFLRHRRRSLITSAAVALGLAMMLAFVGMADDGHRRMAEMGVHMGAGHVLVQGAGYQQEQTLDQVVEDPARVVAAARGIRGVVEVAPRLHTGGLLTAGAQSSAVAVAGVDPLVEPKVSSIAESRRLVAGTYLRPTAAMDFANEPADIYLGDALATKLQLAVGDRVVLTVSPRGSGQPVAAAFAVRGIFHVGLAELDGFYVEIPLDRAQELLGMAGAVTQVAVVLDNPDATPRVTAAVQAALQWDDSLEILPWQEALKELHEAIVLDDAGMYLFMVVVFLIVGLGIYNTMIMSVVERTREFGVMMAIGTSGRRLFGVIMAEALVLGLVSAALGLAIGLGIHSWMASTGIDLAALYGEEMEFSGIVLEGRMYSYLTAGTVVQWTVLIIAIVLASALFPALRATRLQPIEAMRHA